MAAPTAPASFSSLPVELRTKIFRYVLPARKVTPLLLSHEWLRSDQPPQCGGQRQILRVSKAFNIDAAPILYNDSLFRFNDAFELVLFLQMIKTKNAAYLKSIKVEELCSFSKRNKEVDLGQGQCISWRQFAETLASACPNLTHLAVGEVPLKIGNEWVSARLKNFQAGLYELPMLRNVYYSNFDTVLTARPSKVNQKVHPHDVQIHYLQHF